MKLNGELTGLLVSGGGEEGGGEQERYHEERLGRHDASYRRDLGLFLFSLNCNCVREKLAAS